ncbi:hypothetical protein A1359_06675 [Methylomonas lenta]|uniref:Uncharacterized protein n=1 Tax=Methylomonas lenta TaxID=980561 RepID=A0A177NG72_9GAMM|nr:hypothetical protein A1359_06675 [Methylomonas lenta]
MALGSILLAAINLLQFCLLYLKAAGFGVEVIVIWLFIDNIWSIGEHCYFARALGQWSSTKGGVLHHLNELLDLALEDVSK